MLRLVGKVLPNGKFAKMATTKGGPRWGVQNALLMEEMPKFTLDKEGVTSKQKVLNSEVFGIFACTVIKLSKLNGEKNTPIKWSLF